MDFPAGDKGRLMDFDYDDDEDDFEMEPYMSPVVHKQYSEDEIPMGSPNRPDAALYSGKKWKVKEERKERADPSVVSSQNGSKKAKRRTRELDPGRKEKNRIGAQESWKRKKVYITGLEEKISGLQDEVKMLWSQIKIHQYQRNLSTITGVQEKPEEPVEKEWSEVYTNLGDLINRKI
jgi:hypothetical protein